MKKRDQYKRLVNFMNSVIIIGVLTAVFAYVWYSHFANNKELLQKIFFRRGNYVLIALYAAVHLAGMDALETWLDALDGWLLAPFALLAAICVPITWFRRKNT